jgi:hypothetical protein
LVIGESGVWYNARHGDSFGQHCGASSRYLQWNHYGDGVWGDQFAIIGRCDFNGKYSSTTLISAYRSQLFEPRGVVGCGLGFSSADIGRRDAEHGADQWIGGGLQPDDASWDDSDTGGFRNVVGEQQRHPQHVVSGFTE